MLRILLVTRVLEKCLKDFSLSGHLIIVCDIMASIFIIFCCLCSMILELPFFRFPVFVFMPSFRTTGITFNSVPWFLQHVPKINGDIPSVDEAKSDHQRLMDR